MTAWTTRRKAAKTLPFIEGVPAGVAPDIGRVIVIGAGAAGLTAARVLQDHGRDVLVLEGRDRMGGRLNTINVDGGIVDEGGNWIHGGPANPLYHLVRAAGLTMNEDSFIHPLRVKVFEQHTGRGANPLTMLYFLRRAAKLAERFSGDSLTTSHPEAHLGERLDAEISQVRGKASKRRFRFMLRTIIDLTAAKESELLDPNGLALNPDYEQENDYVIEGGYDRLVQRLAAGLNVRLETAVEAIRYDTDGVEVVTNEGSQRGSHVIVTVPLGVLKAGVISFRPKLPPRKIQAINNIGVGVVEKVILRFDEPFWRLSKTQPRSVFYISDTQGEFPAFIDASDSAGRPVLVAFLTGEHVHLLETDAEAMVDRASQILKSIFGDKYRAPTSVHVTNWGTDPFSLGSYSTPTVGVTTEDYEQLAQPVGQRVLFAGEATYREHAGFVEGAMGSGIREARRLLGREVDLQLNPS